MRLIVALVVSLLTALPAHAEWREARTDHVVLTINETEENARAFAIRLERFDAALRRLYNVAERPGTDVRRIEIFALDPSTYIETCNCYGTLGYYVPRSDGAVIFSEYTPDRGKKAKQGELTAQAVLLHEYSHHFFFSNFSIAYPYWFAEGFAEFNANASFEPDGGVIIGYPANYRGSALKSGVTLTPKQLFDPYRYGFGQDIDLVYGRGWLLTHYLMLSPARSGQLTSYLAAMAKGVSSLDAAQSTFGDLKQLNAALDRYSRGRLLPPLRIAPHDADVRATVTALSPGRAAMLPVRALMMNGVAKNFRNRVAARAAKIAKRFPLDAIVQSRSADAELLAERLDQADIAADRALAIDPVLIDALIAKGSIAVKRASLAAASVADWTKARSWYLKANRIDPNAVLPLYLYNASFYAAKTSSTSGAAKGLRRAAILAPESNAIRFDLARQSLDEGKIGEARALLLPIVFSPHRASKKNVPQDVLTLIDAGKIAEAKTAISVPPTDED